MTTSQAMYERRCLLSGIVRNGSSHGTPQHAGTLPQSTVLGNRSADFRRLSMAARAICIPRLEGEGHLISPRPIRRRAAKPCLSHASLEGARVSRRCIPGNGAASGKARAVLRLPPGGGKADRHRVAGQAHQTPSGDCGLPARPQRTSELLSAGSTDHVSGGHPLLRNGSDDAPQNDSAEHW